MSENCKTVDAIDYMNLEFLFKSMFSPSGVFK